MTATTRLGRLFSWLFGRSLWVRVFSIADGMSTALAVIAAVLGRPFLLFLALFAVARAFNAAAVRAAIRASEPRVAYIDMWGGGAEAARRANLAFSTVTAAAVGCLVTVLFVATSR